ncbi:MAG: LCP family protein [Chloroflexi bacterium]|nr:LCP family protein [Chloroflexota bacterium]
MTYSPRSAGLAALLSALLPGLGQAYAGGWRRALVFVAAPAAGLAIFAAAFLLIEPVAAAMVRRAALVALLVVGGLFAYHVMSVMDAFASRTMARRSTRDAAILVVALLGLALLYAGLQRQSNAWAGVVAGVFEQTTGRTVGAGTSAVGTTAPGWSGRDRLNVLLLGLDSRDDQITQNTDTVILLSLDPVDQTGSMLSIPRDTLVEIPTVGSDKVNAAYAYGGGGEKGGEFARRTVERFLGVPIHAYALIDFAAFRETIDSVGGILVDVRRALRDEAYPTSDYGIERISLLAGPQVMDGDEALRYARSRHDSNDFSRARRQQAVILALRTRLGLGGVFRLPGIVQRVGPLVRTSFDPGNVLPLARTALSIDVSAIRSEQLLPCNIDVPHCELEEQNAADGYYLIPDLAKVRSLVTDLFAGRLPASSR